MSVRLIIAWLILTLILMYGAIILWESQPSEPVECCGSTDCPGGVCVKPCKCQSCKCMAGNGS